MTLRTTRKTVTFAEPFSLAGIDGEHSAGAYEVDTDEETIDSVSFLAWRRIATTIHIRRDGASRAYAVDPVDLDHRLLRDKGMTVRPAAEA